VNDLIFINNLEDSQLRQPYRVVTASSPPAAKDEGQAADSYTQDAGAGCSVCCVNSGSTGGFWRFVFRLFGSD